MKKNTWLRPLLTGILLISALVVLNSSRPAGKIKEKSCCNKNNTHCPAMKKDKAPGYLILDNLSRQFMAVASFFD